MEEILRQVAPKKYEKILKHVNDDNELYQIIGEIMKTSEKEVLKNIKKGKTGWNSVIYDEIRDEIKEHDDYIVKPFDVVDGVTKCGKCGSHKTWSFQKQIRSSDEPMTTFSRCVDCGNTWSV